MCAGVRIRTLREAKFVILERLGEQSTDVGDVLGTHGTSAVQLRLGRPPEEDELTLLGLALDALRRDRLIRDDVRNPNQLGMLAITQLGRTALKRRALDDLDEILMSLRTEFVTMRDEAWLGVLSGEWERMRQGILSMRQLCDEFLHLGAPDGEVQIQPWFVPDSSRGNGITRAHRARLILGNHRPSLEESELRRVSTFVARAAGALNVLHVRSPRPRAEMEGLIVAAETALASLVR